MPEFQQGDSVRYKPVGGTFSPHFPFFSLYPYSVLNLSGPDSNSSESVGVIRQVRTASSNMTGRNVEASGEDPRYEVCIGFFAVVDLFIRVQNTNVGERARSRTNTPARNRPSRNRTLSGLRSKCPMYNKPARFCLVSVCLA